MSWHGSGVGSYQATVGDSVVESWDLESELASILDNSLVSYSCVLAKQSIA